jgi:hypothetical protein
MEHSATYFPEDNKLRLYAAHRLDAEDYAKVKAAGFKWAPKQELFVAPKWTPEREDLLLEMCGEIGDEDYSPEERAADRAERFSNYRDKRRAEAGGLADRFDAGPSAFGHQSRARAERQASRHDRNRTGAVSQWSKAEYWQRRTEGVISSALYKSSAPVRRSRILRLESELRCVVASYTPADNPPHYIMQTAFNDTEPTQHVWVGPKGRGGRWIKVSSLEPLKRGYSRWVAHYELRLTYEKAMLAEEGGTVAEVEIVPGGFFGRFQVQKVNKSPATGRVVSVGIIGEKDYYRGEPVLRADGTYGAPWVVKSVNIERMAADSYRAPTAEELETFKAKTAAAKKERKATAPKAPSLINPTNEDAERLQAVWNAVALARHNKQPGFQYAKAFEPSEVLYMTQDKYSQLSKGAYARCETRTVYVDGRLSRRSSNMYSSEGTAYDNSLTTPVGKIRTAYGRPDRIIVLTDKPQKALAIDWVTTLDNATPEAAPAGLLFA